MKISLAFCLVILALIVNVKIGARPIGQIQSGDSLLLDNGGIGQQNDISVNITEPGLWDVFVANNKLAFEICTMECNASVLICYDGDTPSQNTSDLCDSGCGFYITGLNNTISVTTSSASEYERQEKKGECESFKMNNGEFFFRDEPFTSCVPKIDNGMVKLNVSMASADCPLIIKNAFVLPESTSAPSTTTAAKLVRNSTTSTQFGYGNGTTTDESATFMSSYWWIFLIIGFVIIGGIVAGFLIYCLIFKKEKKPTIVSPAVKRHLKRPRTKIIEQPPPEEEEENKRPKLPSSILDPSSILSQKWLLNINKEERPQQIEPKKEEPQPSTDLKTINVAA